jgi:hypothetical protein
MVSKSGVWAHFGLWDFKRADLYTNAKNKDFYSFSQIANKYDYTDEEIEELYDQVSMIDDEKEANNWISPWPGYIKETNCKEVNNTVECIINLNIGQQESATVVLEKYVFNKETEEGLGYVGAYVGNTKVGDNIVGLKKFITEINGKLKTFEGEGVEIGMINIGNKAIISSPELVDSTFTKLFYFDGAYTTYFEKFSDGTTKVSNDRIIVWKVNWEGKVDNGPEPLEIQIE